VVPTAIGNVSCVADVEALLALMPADLLPAGSLFNAGEGPEPVLWLSAEPATPGLWAQARELHPGSGLWPVLLAGLDGEPERPWQTGELSRADVGDPGECAAEVLLSDWWQDHASEAAPEVLAPLGQQWPGTAAPQVVAETEPAADRLARELAGGGRRLGLVPTARGADAIAALGWWGACNVVDDTAQLSAVLRSWEERFSAEVVGIGFDTLEVSVASPPRDPDQALRLAAEHFACCPDNVWPYEGEALRQYAGELVGAGAWTFRWD
jgi:hypothetical protein